MTQPLNPNLTPTLQSPATTITKLIDFLKGMSMLIFPSLGAALQETQSTEIDPLMQEAILAERQKQQNEYLQRQQFAHRLIQRVETTEAYLQSDLNLISLAQQMHTTPHYLSKVINEQLGRNFIDFINEYRIKTAQKRLLQKQYSHYTILAIGLAAGFNSKSAFYAVFKRQTGMTPSQYRKANTSTLK